MKKLVWILVAVALAAGGAWLYGMLVRQEDDPGGTVRLLAVAEEQRLDLSFSRSGRIVARVPDEGETIHAGDVVTRIEEPGLSEDMADLERQRQQIEARDRGRVEEVARLQAQLAQTASEEKRISRLVREGIASPADLETLQHKREEISAAVRAQEVQKGDLDAQGQSLETRLEKLQRFEKEGTLVAPTSGVVLSRQHRQGEWVASGDPIVTLQVEAPYLRVEVPEERLSAFSVGRKVRAWPQTRPSAVFTARVISIRPRAEFATRRNWGLQSRDLKTFSVRLAPENASAVSGQTFVVEAGKS